MVRPNILIAEDDPIVKNLSVAMLKELGCEVDSYDNGKEAFDAFKKNKIYDLVILDCQMPELNGFETTMCMREHERERYGMKMIPIIAWSGFVKDMDSKRLFSAGIDDYLSKPVNLTTLKTLLDKWLFAEELHIDKVAIETLVSLQDEDNKAFLTSVFQEFCDHTNQNIEKLKMLASEEDIIMMRSMSHQLKSSCAMVGAKKLARLCAQLEFKVANNDLNNLHFLLGQIQSEHQQVKPILAKKLLGNHE